jgi:hypothetical protein
MITYTAGPIEPPNWEDGIDMFCAGIHVDGDSNTGSHSNAIQCWGVTKEEAIERRGLILAGLSALSMVEVVYA